MNKETQTDAALRNLSGRRRRCITPSLWRMCCCHQDGGTGYQLCGLPVPRDSYYPHVRAVRQILLIKGVCHLHFYNCYRQKISSVNKKKLTTYLVIDFFRESMEYDDGGMWVIFLSATVFDWLFYCAFLYMDNLIHCGFLRLL